jgi:ABC-2 type transport system permease protein
MREMLIVFQRDFLAHVNTRAFIISTILVPTLIAVMFILPRVMDSGSARTFVLVNEASGSVGDTFVQALTAEPRTARDNRYTLEHEPGRFETLRPALNERVLANEIEGYVVIPPDVLTGQKVLYRARSVSSPKVIFDLQLAAQRAVQSEKLRQSGVSNDMMQVLWQRVNVDSVRITQQGEKPGSALSGFMFAYLVAFLIYILVVMYGASILRSVFEEKRNRISEIVVSSISAGRFLTGKILGVGAAAVVQVVIWAVIVVTILGLPILSGNISADTTSILAVDPEVAVALLFFFLVGFFLYASMFAALGAAASSEQDAQSMQGLLFVPIIVPLLFMGAVINDPAGRTAQVLSLIPFTSPITMPMRLASAPVPAGELVTSALVLLATLLVILWAAGKIYRIGILSTGKRPGLVELYRWVRTA